ncbi:MAG: hypothetical protein OHM56_09645 [Spiroplasma phoeniceum]|nr:MAG: hypothetical protein OHM57_09045 [Spiroplasma phoeniceum]UZQ31846.1 MAG: hypothetical protein OHM56_09645 [Spiroplasma phoeniceum]
MKKLKLKKTTIAELTEKVNSRYRFKSHNDGRHYLLLIEDITDKIRNNYVE